MGKALSEMINDIINGANKHLYPTWAKHAPLLVRRELAIQGYELDTLIDDPGCGIHCIQYAKKKLPEGMTLTEEDFDYLKGMDNTWDVDNYMTKYDEPIECVSGI